MKLACLVLAALLCACGGGGGWGGGSAPAVPDVPAANPQHVLFEQRAPTAVLNDPRSEDQFPRDAGFVVTFDLGSAPITDDARGVGLVNDSWAAPAGSSAIKTMNYAWMPSIGIHPWRDFGSQARVCAALRAAVPESTQQAPTPDTRPRGSWGAYTGLDLWLTDRSMGKVTSGRTIIMSAFFFIDSAGGGRKEDGGPFDYLTALNAVQFSGSVGQSSFFETAAGRLQTQPWSDARDFGICLTRDQAMFLIAAAHEMLGGVMDLNDVAIKQVVIGNETNLGNPLGRARLVSHFSGVTVYIEQARQEAAVKTNGGKNA